MAFEIGFVPCGWKRGSKLRVINPTCGPRALIGQIWEDEPPVVLVDFDPMSVAMLTFTEYDIQKVNAWIEWWNGSETHNVGLDRRTRNRSAESADALVRPRRRTC